MRLRLRRAPEFFDDRLPLVRGERHHGGLGALRHVADGSARRLRRRRLDGTRRRGSDRGNLNRRRRRFLRLGDFGQLRRGCRLGRSPFGAGRGLVTSASFGVSGCAAGSTPCGAAARKAIIERKRGTGRNCCGRGNHRRRLDLGDARDAVGGGALGRQRPAAAGSPAHRNWHCRVADKGWPRKYWHRPSSRNPAQGWQSRRCRKSFGSWLSGLNFWVCWPRNCNTQLYWYSSALHPDCFHLVPPAVSVRSCAIRRHIRTPACAR